MRIQINGVVVDYDPSSGAMKAVPRAAAETIDAGGVQLQVGKVYSGREQDSATLPPGYRWSSMMFGLGDGGVNRKLEKVEQQRPC